MRVVVILVVAATLAASAGARNDRTLTVTLKSVQFSSTGVDQPPQEIPAGKFSPGDTLILRDNLFNRVAQLGRAAGAKIGTDRSTLTFVSPTAARVVGSAFFPGGSVTFKGHVDASATGALSLTITGGTGKFAGARGTVTEPASDSDPKNATNVYHLILP